jgi:hypothetical protein
MREILRSNDALLINFAQSVLREAGIGSFVADQHMSVVEGSIGAFPRRLLVGEADWAPARRALVQADLAKWLVSDGNTDI